MERVAGGPAVVAGLEAEGVETAVVGLWVGAYGWEYGVAVVRGAV